MANEKRNLYTGSFSVVIQADEEYIINPIYVENLYFIEDIFSYSIVGKISFQDVQGIFEFLPLTGNEKITIKYGVDEEVQKVFDIYKVNRIIPSYTSAKPYENSIEMILVDENFYNLTNKQYSLSWKNTKYSDIVKDISENMVGIDQFKLWEDSVERADYFYMPYWSPKTAINWLIKRCSGLNFRQPGYLYYKNSQGMNFITIESLLQGKGGKIEHSQDTPTGVYNFTGEGLNNLNEILGYRLSGIDNLSRLTLKGEHKKGFDFTRKKFLDESFDYNDGIDNLTLLGRYSLFKDISDTESFNDLTGESSETVINNLFYNNWFKKYSMQQTLSIIVPGHEERYAGGMINVQWPSLNDKELYNKNLNGKYLVKSITHQFDMGTPTYKQKMILIKNGYEDSDKEDLKKAVKKNIRK